MKQPVISVIVPVYNTEKYLDQCIHSILCQTFADFELLLINDGSSDNSGDICEKYASKDSRIRVFHKKNGGVGSARNEGVDRAVGEWIVFVDSDDYIRPPYLENLLLQTNETIDLVISFPEVILKNKIYRLDHYQEGLVSENDTDKLFSIYDLQEHTSPWGKLYRTSIVKNNNIRFCENMCFGEDAVFLYNFILYARNVFILNKADYCYRGEIEGSLSKRMNAVDDEYINYSHIYKIVGLLIKQKSITDKTALSKLNVLIEIYIWRILNSLYHNSASYKKRLHIISLLDFSVISLNGKMSKKDFILKSMLKNKLYWLYDMLRTFAKKFRKNDA